MVLYPDLYLYLHLMCICLSLFDPIVGAKAHLRVQTTVINVVGLGLALPMRHYERISEDISDAPTQALAQTSYGGCGDLVGIVSDS